MDPFAPPSTESGDLDELVAVGIARAEQEGTDGLEAFYHEHPAQAEKLRRRMGSLLEMGMIQFGRSHSKSIIPDRLGEYRLLKKLGGGGMGVVYLAEQESLGRQVAIKLIKPEHMYFSGARERFRREVQAAACLQHPGIAPIHTVGEEGDLPYYTMDYIEGCTLAEVLKGFTDRHPSELTGSGFYQALCAHRCEEHLATQLQPPAFFDGTWVEVCFRIVREVAEALEHAHRRGILHRDVKPSNIMVTPEGRVMLLDFGLASTSGGSGDLTVSGSLPGSLPYMSPEQVRGKPNGLDRRSDVYSLGVTLYQLVTLHSPFLNRDTEDSRSLILQGRKQRPRDCNSKISWEAETVVLTACDAERERRYQTAAAFARDIENCLEGLPIEARRPGILQRGKSWVKLHPATAVASVSAFLLLVVTPTVFAVHLNSSNQAIFLAHQKEKKAASDLSAKAKELAEQKEALAIEKGKAEQAAVQANLVASLMVKVLEIPNFWEGYGANVPVSEFLTGASELILGDPELEEKPEVRVRLLVPLAEAFASLGMDAEGLPLFEEALEINREIHGDGTDPVAESHYNLAKAYGGLKRFDDALQEARSAYEINLRNHGLNYVETISAWASVGAIHTGLGKYEEAHTYLDDAMQRLSTLEDPPLKHRATLLRQLGQLHLLDGKLGEAEDYMRECLNLQIQVHGLEHPRVAGAKRDLGRILMYLSEFEEGEQLLNEAQELDLANLGANHPIYALGLVNYAIFMRSVKRYDEAVNACKQAFEIFERTEPLESKNRFDVRMELAETYRAMGKADLAEPLLQEALPLLEKILSSDHIEYGMALHNYAINCHQLGKWVEANKAHAKCISIIEGQLSNEHPAYSRVYFDRALVCIAQEMWEEAERCLHKSFPGSREVRRGDAPKTSSVYARLAAVMNAQGYHEQAYFYIREATRARLGGPPKIEEGGPSDQESSSSEL